jgi:hypothetical protein
MPSVSKAQQKLMGMAYALKKGDMDPADASQEVKDLADSMTLQQLKDFAETPHKGLPDHVKEYFYWWDTQAQMMAAQGAAVRKDQTDPLIQSFMDFIDGKKNKKVKVDEDFSAPAASVTNTPGMGNVVPANVGSTGSGDIFSGSGKKKKKKKKVKVFEEYIEEMALADVNSQKILAEFDSGDKKRKEQITDVISGRPHTDRSRLEKDILDLSYEDIMEIMQELELL